MSSPPSRSQSRSSPARHTPNGFRRAQANGYHSPLRHSTAESPSRQFVEEFSKVYLDDERLFRKKLDEHAEEQEKLHREALEKSLQKHEEVRQSVERAQERLRLELDRVKRERLEQENAALERSRREAAEADAAAKQREIDRAKRQEEELKQAAARQRELDEAERRIDAQKRQNADEKAKREAERAKEEADRKAQEAAAAAREKEKKSVEPVPLPPTATTAQAQPQPQANGTPQPTVSAAPQSANVTLDPSVATGTGALIPNGIQTPSDAREAEHRRYVDLHDRLKKMREETETEAKRLGQKAQLGDMRREFTKIVGQINKVDKTANKNAILGVRRILEQGAQMTNMMIDITPYIISVDPAKLKEGTTTTQYPAALLYLFHAFVKAVFSQLVQEVSRDSQAADPLGVLVVTIFATPLFHYNGHPLTDILWAKYHKACPVLFGIYGPQTTPAGRRRLGWRVSDNQEIPQEVHYDRMTGFAAGFAAITLRDFTKSQNQNPAPNHLFWTALARILNTPNDQQTPTHYIILINLLKFNINRFITFFGAAAIAALRKACIDFPSAGGPLASNGQPDSTVQAVKSLPLYFQNELKLSL